MPRVELEKKQMKNLKEEKINEDKRENKDKVRD